MASADLAPPLLRTDSRALVTRGDREGIQDAARIGHYIFFAPDRQLSATDMEKYQLLAKEMQGLTVFRDTKRVPLNFTAESIIQTHNLLKDLQDSRQFGGLRILCDGMGGQSKGHIAANMAIAVIQSEVLQAILKNTITQEVLVNAIKVANDAVMEYSFTHKIGTGTTVLTALTDNTGMTHCASFGDSRMFLRRTDGSIRQINLDTSLVVPKVLKGEIPPSEIYTHPQRNYTEGLPSGSPAIQAESIQLTTGEQILMASDGVWEAVMWNHNPELDRVITFYLQGLDREYSRFLAEGKSPHEALQLVNGWLFRKINLYGLPPDATTDQIIAHLTRREVGQRSKDNATAIIIEAETPEGTEPARKKAEYFRAGYRFYTLDGNRNPVECLICRYDPTTGWMIVKMKENGQEKWDIVPQEQVQTFQSMNPSPYEPALANAQTWEDLENALGRLEGFFYTKTDSDGRQEVRFITKADMIGSFHGLRSLESNTETLRARLAAIPPAAREAAVTLLREDMKQYLDLLELEQ